MAKAVNVGVVGVGNCASSLAQGLAYYSREVATPVGLTNPVCAGYTVSDVRITSAFDVEADKIGRDLSEAIWTAPNNALKFAEVPHLGVTVRDGILADGVGHHAAGKIEARGHATLDGVIEELERTATHVVVSFLPVGSQRAAELYAEAALRAGCAFVNCMPAVLARSAEWAGRFEKAGLPLLGDDLKSQFGATLVHHAMVDTLTRNGVQLRSTSQVVRGGNMDFLNMQDPERVASKKMSKIQGFGGAELPADRVHFAAEYVPSLEDRKIALIRLEGEAFGGTPLELELRLSVEDSPSAAGNVLDAVRHMKAALDRGAAGVLHEIAASLMKAPPRPVAP